MKKRFIRVMSVILVFALMITGMSVASSAVVEIIDENLIYGTEIAHREDFYIAPGITESYIVTQDDDGSNRVNSYVIEVDTSNPEIGIITSYKDYMNGLGEAEWGMQTLRDQAFEAEDYYRNTLGDKDFEVVAGVNGDFFNMGNGAPTGSFVMNGIKYNENKNWPFFAILDDGSFVIGERGDKLPKNAVQVIGGPEVLIKDGVFTDAVNTSGYGVEAHPRTAIGIKADGDIVLLVSDGRMAPESCGQTFHMLAEELLALGCVDALCLDGGGSASFVSQRENEEYLELRNIPSDGIERTVSTSLLVYTNTDTNKRTYTSYWAEEEGNVYYYGADGEKVTGEQTIDGFTYVFGEDGALTSYAKVNVDGTLLVNSWTDDMYYLGEDGLPLKGEKEIDSVTFTFDESTGKLRSSEMKSKWFEFAESVCYFNKNGNLVKGDKKIGVNNYKFDDEGRLTVYACVKDDGTLAKNQWIGQTYYLGEDGLPVKGKITLDKRTYTFGDDGKLVKGYLVKEGFYTYYYIAGQRQRNWHLIDGYWHYFDRQTGFGMASLELDGRNSVDTVKDGKYPVSTTDARLEFKFDNKGRLVGGAWLETDFGKAYYWGNHQRVTGWQVIDKNLYYFNQNAYTVSGTQTIDGTEYTFRDSGKLNAKSEIVYTSDKAYSFDESGKVNHVYTVTETAVSCTTDGVRTLTCDDCDDVKTELIGEATGHNYTAVVTPPTVEEQGFTTYTCEFCADSYVSDYVGAIGHDYDAVVTAPTCTEKGYTTYSCTTCDDSYVSDYVDATGHNYETVVTAPTCTEKGFTTYTCSVCADTYTSDHVDANGHDYTAVVTAPTCTSKGYTTYTCAVCGAGYVGDYTDAEEHKYAAVVTAPTCTEKGYTTYVCECGYKYVGSYTDPAHSYGEWEVVTPAKYQQEGLEKRICKGCGNAEERAIPALEDPSDEYINADTGDINNDGKITAMDARLALRISAKLDEASEIMMQIADFNGDGKVTAMDARLILRKSAKLD